MSLEGALLGMISSQGPVTGYDLTKTFRLSMAHYWHARHGQIYPALDGLRRKGLVTSRTQVQHDRPNKKLYSITDKGRTALLRWLRAPSKPFQIKQEALLKCRFYALLPFEEAAKRLGDERRDYNGLLRHYRELERHLGNMKTYPDADRMFEYFTIRRGVVFLEKSVEWCDWAIDELKRFNNKRRRTGPNSKPAAKKSKPARRVAKKRARA